jgi:hypothetical protein
MHEYINKYELIGDLGSALIRERANLAWLWWGFVCDACFASLLGTTENGIWSLAPKT